MLSTRFDRASTSGGPELHLLLACLRGQNPDGLLQETPVNWRVLLDAAEAHSVLPLLHRSLANHPRVPPEVREQLAAQYRAGVRRNLILTAELIRLLDEFQAAGIKVLPYKGPAMAEALYGDIGARTFSDLDLLVRSADALRAMEVLETAGYRPVPPLPVARMGAFFKLASEQMFRRTTGAVLVELQWRMAPRYFSVDTDLEWLWKSTVPVRLEEREVASPSPEALLVLLSVHGAKHQWERIGWVADVAQLVRRYPCLDFNWVLEMARGLGVERFVLLALALAGGAPETELREGIDRRLSEDRRVAALCRKIERTWSPKPEGITGIAGHWFTLRARERWSDRVRYTARLVLAPNPRDWALLPLPGFLSPLYFLLRPVRLFANAVRGMGRKAATAASTAGDREKAPHHS